jgi:hypothetical protein
MRSERRRKRRRRVRLGKGKIIFRADLSVLFPPKDVSRPEVREFQR